MLELTVSQDAVLASELERASVLCRAQRVKHVRLVLPDELELNAPLVTLLADFVDRSDVRSVELVHASSSMGFVCSALRLRCPRVELNWMTGRPTSNSFRPPPLEVETTKSGRHRVAPVVSESDWLVIDAEPGESDRVYLQRAFGMAREAGAARVALGLAREYRLRPDWSSELVQEVRRAPALRELLLVHPSLGAGFVASSVGLECPGVRVSSSSTRPQKSE